LILKCRILYTRFSLYFSFLYFLISLFFDLLFLYFCIFQLFDLSISLFLHFCIYLFIYFPFWVPFSACTMHIYDTQLKSFCRKSNEFCLKIFNNIYYLHKYRLLFLCWWFPFTIFHQTIKQDFEYSKYMELQDKLFRNGFIDLRV